MFLVILFNLFSYWQILQAVYFSLAFVNDFVEPVKDQALVGKIKDYIFAAFTFPLALNVAGLFWSLYAYDRYLVFPKEADAFFPSWLNHILHTNVAIFIVVEMFILQRQYPSRKGGLCGLMVFIFSYLAWLHVIRYHAGVWPYPILNVLDLPSRFAFFIFTMGLPVLMYFLGEWLNEEIWGQQKSEPTVQRKSEIKEIH